MIAGRFGAALVGLTLAIGPALASTTEGEESVDAVRAGDEAPSLVLDDFDGRGVSLDALRGRIVLVELWASWCVPCRRSLPELDRMARERKWKNVTFLAIDTQDDPEAADAFLAEVLPHPAVRLIDDGDGEAIDAFGADALPALYLIDRDGTVRLVALGYGPGRVEGIARAIAALGGAVRESGSRSPSASPPRPSGPPPSPRRGSSGGGG